MQLHPIDIGIILLYIVVVVVAGLWISRKASDNLDSYFLGGKRIPWYALGISNASGMFDIAGTMWLVYLFFVYGMKSVWIPWLWPTFNQIFLMIYLSVWLRRSGVMTGAEWLKTRFGGGTGYELSHISVVFFALVSVVAFLAYAFKGIGKFSAVFFPWGLDPNTYAIVFMGITTVYIIFGGMFSVVLTDVIQFTLLAVASVCVCFVAMSAADAAAIQQAVPAGWGSVFFGWRLDLDWSEVLASVNARMAGDGYSLFSIFFMLVLFKGVLASMAGPPPNYDLQRILSARSPREAALTSFSVSAVLFLPRYLLIGGIGVLGVVFFGAELEAMGSGADFEQVLPYVIRNFLPVGVVGIILAGLLAAFMSTFTSTVNAGASYVVNDIYKRYLKRDGADRHYVVISYMCSMLVVVVGVTFGFFVDSIDSVVQWIVAGLYGGFIAPNVLKWHWWRLNGHGYFWGMMSGIIAAIAFQAFFAYADIGLVFGLSAVLATWPLLLLISLAGSIGASLLTAQDSDATLMAFYRQVRPWGFWGPVREKVLKDDPAFVDSSSFGRDAVNVGIGTVWQLVLTIIPLSLVLRDFSTMAVAAVVLAVTSVALKFNWYDKLEN